MWQASILGRYLSSQRGVTSGRPSLPHFRISNLPSFIPAATAGASSTRSQLIIPEPILIDIRVGSTLIFSGSIPLVIMPLSVSASYAATTDNSMSLAISLIALRYDFGTKDWILYSGTWPASWQVKPTGSKAVILVMPQRPSHNPCHISLLVAAERAYGTNACYYHIGRIHQLCSVLCPTSFPAIPLHKRLKCVGEYKVFLRKLFSREVLVDVAEHQIYFGPLPAASLIRRIESLSVASESK